jgi:hypothetical protein
MIVHASSAEILCAVLAFLLVLQVIEASGQGPDKDRPSALDAAKAVDDALDGFKATGFAKQEVKDEPVARAFPKYLFFGVTFRQYPVARLIPKGMSTSNVYAVGPDGKARLLKQAADLHGFFKSNLAPAQEEKAAKDAARAYVRLVEELHQDGFYKFALQDDSTKVEGGPEGKKATARAVVMAGGNGELSAALSFDRGGVLQSITDTVTLKPGPRPICQASKLLDPDPIIRRMAQRDLVIMGRAARPYLDEQRTRAEPALQQAIDRVWDLILLEDR